MSHSVTILGFPFRKRSEEQTHRVIAALLRKRGNARIFTPNAEILLRASKDRSLRDLLRSADFLLPDGVGVILASRLLGSPLPGRITGIDTAEWILSYAAKQGLSVYLLGGKPGVARDAAQAWKTRRPALKIAGTHHGYFDKERGSRENQAVVAKIRRASPDLLFVCFGFPAQERWIAENTPALPSLRLSMGLGGSFDVWSGQKKRAPRLVQQMGAEWLWRAMLEPRRLLPLLRTPLFLGAVLSTRRK